METQRRLPIGIQDFEDLRNENCIYIDKTDYIWKLANTGKVYFLSRPRRFGKSLLVSTIKAYFSGKKNLFDGLKISELEKGNPDAWKKYPVLHFDFNGMDYSKKDSLERKLDSTLSFYEKIYGRNENDGGSVTLRFASLIKAAHDKTGLGAVVLVDEYDKSLLESGGETSEANRRLFKGVFGNLKSSDGYLKFVFITGVTKFSKVSIFSDLNHLEDISLDNSYSAICGITDNELRTGFEPEIKAMAAEQELTYGECLAKLAKTYDGYHFSKKSEGVYNPFSLLNALKKKDFSDYWFETGTPTFLVEKLKNSLFRAENFDAGVECRESEIKNYRTDDPNPVPLFYQSGYLTIKDFDKEFRTYTLKFPNDEVRYGFLESLVPLVLGEKEDESPFLLKKMVLALKKGETEAFKDELVSLFASMPYTELPPAKYESEWRNQIFLVLRLLGQNVECEVRTAKGRCDCVVETKNFVYLFEFKLDKSADEALEQIEAKDYALKYKADERKIVEIGVNFSTEKRNIAEWKEVRL